jgi:hypothetical protein
MSVTNICDRPRIACAARGSAEGNAGIAESVDKLQKSLAFNDLHPSHTPNLGASVIAGRD